MKRIVICCDGTWNSRDQKKDGVPVPTNVVRLSALVKSTDAAGQPQMVYYDPGVGSSGGIVKRAWAAATGAGLNRNLREAYDFLVRTYAPGDAIYLFGYSRGAFTVRSLGGMIANSGILKRAHAHQCDAAFRLYRDRRSDSHPRAAAATAFRAAFAHEDKSPIRFIGVWDTVGALGNPLIASSLIGRRQRFHDTRLSRQVETACHALAIDERRRPFMPTIWHQHPDGPKLGQKLEQRWFAGVHSDAGGGAAQSGLSDLALSWMLEQAAASGLALAPPAIPPLPDWRPNPLSKAGNSMTWFYTLLGPIDRSIDGTLGDSGILLPEQIKHSLGLASPSVGETWQRLDPSVTQRWDRLDPPYRPRNLVAYRQARRRAGQD